MVMTVILRDIHVELFQNMFIFPITFDTYYLN